MVRLADHPDMTIAVHRGRKITTQQGDGWVMMKGSVQWNLVYDWKDSRFKRDSNSGPLAAGQHLTYLGPSALEMLNIDLILYRFE